jgi:hypothetical protein
MILLYVKRVSEGINYDYDVIIIDSFVLIFSHCFVLLYFLVRTLEKENTETVKKSN